MELPWQDFTEATTALVLADQQDPESSSIVQALMQGAAWNKNGGILGLVRAALWCGNDWARREREQGREPGKFECGLTCDFYFDFMRANVLYAWLKPGQAHQDKWGMCVMRDEDNNIRLITPDMRKFVLEDEQDQDVQHGAMALMVVDMPADAASDQELAELASTQWGLKSAIQEHIQSFLP
jgi:hypothetical protein